MNRLLDVEPVAETDTKLLYDNAVLPVEKDEPDEDSSPVLNRELSTDDELSDADVAVTKELVSLDSLTLLDNDSDVWVEEEISEEYVADKDELWDNGRLLLGVSDDELEMSVGVTEDSDKLDVCRVELESGVEFGRSDAELTTDDENVRLLDCEGSRVADGFSSVEEGFNRLEDRLGVVVRLLTASDEDKLDAVRSGVEEVDKLPTSDEERLDVVG